MHSVRLRTSCPQHLLENPRFQRRVRWKAGILRLNAFPKAARQQAATVHA